VLVKPRHGYTSILGHVDMGILAHLLDLLGGHYGLALVGIYQLKHTAREREHSYLISWQSKRYQGVRTNLRLDMSPFSRSLELNQLVVELLSHRDDPIGHLLNLGQPIDQPHLCNQTKYSPLLVKLGGA
jgi:hypothetical protein